MPGPLLLLAAAPMAMQMAAPVVGQAANTFTQALGVGQQPTPQAEVLQNVVGSMTY